MKNILTFAVAVAAFAFFGSQEASAQDYNTGYQFGTGVNQSFNGRSANRFGGGFFAGFNRIGILDRVQAPPYFAQFPPVYYSGIVRRPYGISPFAAPPGIEPVEIRRQNYAPRPVTIKNPYFNSTAPASGPAIKAESNGEKSKVNKST
jgi:hypothetical protein